MSQSIDFTNTFSNGVVQDIDKVNQKPNTMRSARNISLVNNRGENEEDGKWLSVSSVRGNKLSFSHCHGYILMGSIECKDGSIVFLSNGVNSEIGKVNCSINGQNVTYTTIFNDKFDPNLDKLNFGKEELITGEYVYENSKKESVYFVQKGNQKRVINLSLFSPNGVSIHSQGCDSISQYPKYMSVHAMDIRMDLFYPTLKFKSRIPGQLKSGTYQLFLRYISKDGHASVISPETNRIFVTGAKMDGSINGDSDAYKSNHHNRNMTESNVMTEEGIRWIISGIDKRWDYIELGYIYHTTDIDFQEANIFTKIEILNRTEIEVDLVRHSGYSITKGKINERFETILSVGETIEHEKRMYDGDVELIPEIELSKSINISTKIRTYVPDDKEIVFF